MAENRTKEMFTGSNGATKTTKKQATVEFVLAAQLHQAREQIIELKKQVVTQEQIIAQLQQSNALLEVKSLTEENENLREKFGLKTGQRLEKNDDGTWSVIEVSETENTR